MKGIVFNLLERVVVDEKGADAWDDLLDAAGLDGSYTSLGSYADEDLIRLVSVASIALDMPPDDVVRWFGRRALHILSSTYPKLFAGHATTRSFLLTLNDIIHPEVRKLYPGADVPEFDYDTSDPDVLLMAYRSRRKLCALGEGLITGAAEHFNETLALSQPECVHRGDPRCIFRVVCTPSLAGTAG